MNFDTQNWEPFRKDFETESRLTIDSHPMKEFSTGIITRYCQESQNETKYLSYSDVNWDDISFLDIKTRVFDVSGVYQNDPINKITFEESNFGEHVLNKIFSNSQKYYIIHYEPSATRREVKNNNFFYDYFNKMDDPPMLFLEYHFSHEEDIIDFKKNMNTECFVNIYFHKYDPIQLAEEEKQFFDNDFLLHSYWDSLDGKLKLI